MGETNPSYVYTIIDSGPNAASADDIKVLTDSLGYVISQGSAFLLDADNPNSFDFPANYVVLNFRMPPPLEHSAALFETVGDIDHRLFKTDTSGYTQFGRAYLSLQSDVADDEFIAGYVQAAARFGVESTPIVGGVPGLFHGGAAFPGNDWTANPQGEEYLARIPARSHHALAKLRRLICNSPERPGKLAAHDDHEPKTEAEPQDEPAGVPVMLGRARIRREVKQERRPI